MQSKHSPHLQNRLWTFLNAMPPRYRELRLCGGKMRTPIRHEAIARQLQRASRPIGTHHARMVTLSIVCGRMRLQKISARSSLDTSAGVRIEDEALRDWVQNPHSTRE